jgi:hypothetical protein
MSCVEKFLDIGEDGGFFVDIKYKIVGKYYPATLETPAEYREAEWELESVYDADHKLITDPAVIAMVDKHLDSIAREVSGDCEEHAGEMYEMQDWDDEDDYL